MRNLLFLQWLLLLQYFVYLHKQTVNNPKDANGFYIVKWDCANETFAAANDFEVDETFTFVWM